MCEKAGIRNLCALIMVLGASLWPDALAAQEPAEFGDLDMEIVVSQSGELNHRPPLLIHFHGAVPTVADNFHQSGLKGVLVVINCRGLSSAYRRPFENQALFPYLLSHVHKQLAASGHSVARQSPWERVDVSCFSAGYGAVRELLKNPEHVNAIHGVVAADSIYASIHKQAGERAVDEEQMEPFVDFASRALRCDKLFLWTYSQLPVDAYASTSETAHFLLTQMGVEERSLDAPREGEFRLQSIAAKGCVTVTGFPGADGEAHMQHLRQISTVWSWLRAYRAGAQPIVVAQAITRTRGMVHDIVGFR